MRLKSLCEIASDMTLWFSAFPNFRKKWGNLRLSLNVQKQKAFQLQGGFTPWPPDQGLCPWTPLCALAMPPLCQILNTPLAAMLHATTAASTIPCDRAWCSISASATAGLVDPRTLRCLWGAHTLHAVPTFSTLRRVQRYCSSQFLAQF